MCFFVSALMVVAKVEHQQQRQERQGLLVAKSVQREQRSNNAKW